MVRLERVKSMLCTSKLDPTASTLGRSSVPRNDDFLLLLPRWPSFLSLAVRSWRFAALWVQSELVALTESSVSSRYMSSFSPVSQWNLTQRHVIMLNVIACAAFRRSAESLEKLMDVKRQELPETMAAV